MSWNDMPIVHSKQSYCEQCHRITNWRVVEYKDERIETCKSCNTRIITLYEPGNKPVGKEVTKRNRTPKQKKMGRPRKEDKRDNPDAD